MRAVLCLPVLFVCLACGPRSDPPMAEVPSYGTFSIVAHDPERGQLGIAVASRVLAAGAVVPFARADVGAVATQAFANVGYGPRALEMLDDGMAPDEVLDRLTSTDPLATRRQVALVDGRGRVAVHTGDATLPHAGDLEGDGYACQGNILVGAEVLDAMAAAFEEATGPLAERLVHALSAAEAAGGDRRGKQSAALLVVERHGGYARGNDRRVDLRVDDHDDPVAELARLLVLHRRTFPPPPPLPALAGLEREPRTGDTPRAAWEHWRRARSRHAPEPGPWGAAAEHGVYVGTRRTEDAAEVVLGVPPGPTIVRIPVQRTEAGWQVAPP